MSDAKHTPAPWIYIDATKVAGMQFAPACVIRSGDKQVASFSWNDKSPWFPNKEESQANARLIAAAPDLLEALRALKERYVLAVGNEGPECWSANAAIFKAVGS